jgi:hypothetical protein
MGTDNQELKAQKCSKCGGNLAKSFRSEYDEEDEENVKVPVAKCSSCGQVYDRKSEEYYSVFADDLTFDKDSSVFKLGAKGKLKGVEYEITGRIRYQDEDEYEKSTWDEWFAVSTDGAYHYLVEEEGEVHSYEDYTPQSIDIESDPEYIEFDGRKISKSDGYVGRIVYAEGELPWKPEIGEPATMYDFKKDGIKYTIEQSEGEVSITRGEKISNNAVIDAFGSEKDKKGFQDALTKKKNYRRKAIIYLICLAAAFFLTIAGCLNTAPVDGVMKFGNVLSSNILQTENNQRMYQSQVLYGPFEINKGNSLYNASVSIDESVKKLSLEWESYRLLLVPEERLLKALDHQMSVQALKALFDEADALKEPLESYSFSGDFWDEEGRDDEGYWHESDLSSEDDFVIEKPGKYYVYLDLASQNPRPSSSVMVKIEQSSSYRYYIIILIILAGLAYYNFLKSKSSKGAG